MTLNGTLSVYVCVCVYVSINIKRMANLLQMTTHFLIKKWGNCFLGPMDTSARHCVIEIEDAEPIE